MVLSLVRAESTALRTISPGHTCPLLISLTPPLRYPDYCCVRRCGLVNRWWNGRAVGNSADLTHHNLPHYLAASLLHRPVHAGLGEHQGKFTGTLRRDNSLHPLYTFALSASFIPPRVHGTFYLHLEPHGPLAFCRYRQIFTRFLRFAGTRRKGRTAPGTLYVPLLRFYLSLRILPAWVLAGRNGLFGHLHSAAIITDTVYVHPALVTPPCRYDLAFFFHTFCSFWSRCVTPADLVYRVCCILRCMVVHTASDFASSRRTVRVYLTLAAHIYHTALLRHYVVRPFVWVSGLAWFFNMDFVGWPSGGSTTVTTLPGLWR